MVAQKYQINKILLDLNKARIELECAIPKQFVTIDHMRAVENDTPQRQIEFLRWACENDATVEEMKRWIVAQDGGQLSE